MKGPRAAHSSSPTAHGARLRSWRRGSVVVWALGVLLLAGCRPEAQPLVLASTTSTEDTGLFDVLLPAFEEAVPRYQVRVVAVGSGEALRLGERGDADVLLVHSPAAEQEYMGAGHGVARRPVMYNEFVLAGPAGDPAGARGTEILAAFRAVAGAGAWFVSRGDDSGTHRKELALWRDAGIEPRGQPWYVDVGQGMAETLAVAAQRGAYTLSDIATFTTIGPQLGLVAVVEGDSALHNPYSVIVARRARNRAGAQAFLEWITGTAAQQLIGRFGRDRFGRALFTPSATPD